MSDTAVLHVLSLTGGQRMTFRGSEGMFRSPIKFQICIIRNVQDNGPMGRILYGSITRLYLYIQ